MNNPKTDRSIGAPERCMLCFSVDRTLSTVDGGAVCHGFGLTVALPPDHPLLACWECHATLVRLQRFKQRSVQALLLLSTVHKHAELKCLSPLSRSSMIVIDFNVTSLEQNTVSRGTFPAVDIDDGIKIDIDEDLDKLPQCNTWVQSVDLTNKIPVGKEICMDNEVLKKSISVDEAESDRGYSLAKSFNDVNFDSMDIINITDDDDNVADEKANLEKCNDKKEGNTQTNDKNALPTHANDIKPKENSLTIVNETKAKKVQEYRRKRVIGSADEVSTELPNLLKQGKLEEFIGNDEQMRKAHKDMEDMLPRRLRCPTCLECFPGKETLRVHTLERHSETVGAHACDICGLRFTTPESLTEHRATHYKLYRCVNTAHPDCDFVSPSPGLSVYHARMRVKSGPKKKWQPDDELIKMIERRIVEKFVGTTHEVLNSRRVLLGVMKQRLHCFICSQCIVAFTSQPELDRHNSLCHSEVVGPHVCDICGGRFPTPELLNAHSREHYTLYRCRHADYPECNFVCSMAKRVVYHVRQHDHFKKTEGPGRENKQNTKCNVCGGVFRTRQYFRIHMRTHTSTRLYECDMCGKTYNTRTQIHSHIKRHAMRFMCETCGKRCSTHWALKSHSFAHMDHSLRRFECHECRHKFSSRPKLLAHLKVHSGERPHKCDECPREYAEPYQLTQHRKLVHVGEERSRKYSRTKSVHRNAPIRPFQPNAESEKPRSFECSICGKTFKHRVNLRVHFAVHSDARPYKCDQCDKTFKVYATLYTHKFLHKGIKPFKCDVCGSSFASKQSLSTHGVVHSVEPHECNVCHKKFRYRSKYLRHLKTHSLESKQSEDNA